MNKEQDCGEGQVKHQETNKEREHLCSPAESAQPVVANDPNHKQLEAPSPAQAVAKAKSTPSGRQSPLVRTPTPVQQQSSVPQQIDNKTPPQSPSTPREHHARPDAPAKVEKIADNIQSPLSPKPKSQREHHAQPDTLAKVEKSADNVQSPLSPKPKSQRGHHAQSDTPVKVEKSVDKIQSLPSPKPQSQREHQTQPAKVEKSVDKVQSLPSPKPTSQRKRSTQRDTPAKAQKSADKIPSLPSSKRKSQPKRPAETPPKAEQTDDIVPPSPKRKSLRRRPQRPVGKSPSISAVDTGNSPSVPAQHVAPAQLPKAQFVAVQRVALPTATVFQDPASYNQNDEDDLDTAIISNPLLTAECMDQPDFEIELPQETAVAKNDVPHKPPPSHGPQAKSEPGKPHVIKSQ